MDQRYAADLIHRAVLALREVGRPITPGGLVLALAGDLPGDVTDLGPVLWNAARWHCRAAAVATIVTRRA